MKAFHAYSAGVLSLLPEPARYRSCGSNMKAFHACSAGVLSLLSEPPRYRSCGSNMKAFHACSAGVYSILPEPPRYRYQAVILSQRARWRENPPDVQTSQIAIFNIVCTNWKNTNPKFSRRARHPLRAGCRPSVWYKVTEYVQFIDFQRRETACLLPAAGTCDNEKFQCEQVTSCGFAEKTV